MTTTKNKKATINEQGTAISIISQGEEDFYLYYGHGN
jgi:hypothetical protein